MSRQYSIEIDPKCLAAAWKEYDLEMGRLLLKPVEYDRENMLPPGYETEDGHNIDPSWLAQSELVWRREGPRANFSGSREKIREYGLVPLGEPPIAVADHGDYIASYFDTGMIHAHGPNLVELRRSRPTESYYGQKQRIATAGETTVAWWAWRRAHQQYDKRSTCEGCGAAATCAFAFDSYNVDGDCIAEK